MQKAKQVKKLMNRIRDAHNRIRSLERKNSGLKQRIRDFDRLMSGASAKERGMLTSEIQRLTGVINKNKRQIDHHLRQSAIFRQKMEVILAESHGATDDQQTDTNKLRS